MHCQQIISFLSTQKGLREMIHCNKNSLHMLGVLISPGIISNFSVTEIPSFDQILPLKTKKRGQPKGCQYCWNCCWNSLQEK